MTTMKELGLPKDFRLTNRSKEYIINVACYLKFGKQTLSIVDRELQFASCIYEYIYPLEKRDKFVEGITTFNPDREYWGWFDKYNSHFDMQFQKEGFIKTYGKKYSSLVPDYTAFGKFDLDLGVVNSWSADKTNKTELSPIPLRRSDVADDWSKIIWFPDPNVSYKEEDIPGLIPVFFMQKVLDLHLESQAVKQKVFKLKKALKEVLDGYSSVVKLCIDHEEFVSWIELAHQWMEEDDGKTRCSDIPAADAMQDVRSLLK